jgi:hypothetical protein
MAGVPEFVADEDISFDYDDEVYSSSNWGCDTCGYGKPDDTLTVSVSWPKGTWSKTYTGYYRLSDFFDELDTHS